MRKKYRKSQKSELTKSELKERVKELRCLYQLSQLMDDSAIEGKDFLQQAINLIPEALRYPSQVSACISIGSEEYKTKKYSETSVMISASLFSEDSEAGEIRVYGKPQKTPSSDFFLEEEQSLLNTFARNLGNYIQRKDAEKAVWESRENLLITLNSIGDAVIATDHKGKVVQMNPVAEQLTGYKFEEVSRRMVSDVMHIFDETSGDIVENPVFDVLREGKVIAMSNHVVLFSKHRVKYFIADSAAPMRNQDGTIIGVVIVFRDVSNHMKAEQELKHSYDLLNYVIANANGSVAVHDRDLNYVYVSKQYLKEYQVEEQDIIGKHHYEVFPDLPRKWRKAHQKALQGESTFADQDPIYHDDGTVEWTKWHCIPWYDSKGIIGGIIVYTEMITDLVKAKQELQLSEENYRILIENQTDYIVKIDAKGTINFVSPSFCDLFNQTEDELLGQSISQVFGQPAYHNSEIVNMLAAAPHKANIVEQVKTAYGFLWLSWNLKGIFDKNRELQVIVGVGRDVTKQKQAEEALQKLKDNLEVEVREKTKALKEQVAELERFHNATIEREFRITELKKEIDRLKNP
ncbi:MAG: PAS domain S-box protein [Bacteroidales bacterium]